MSFNYEPLSTKERELKYIYSNVSFVSLSHNAQIKNLNRIPLGFESINQRIGRQISQQFLKLRGFIQLQKTEDVAFPGPLGDFSPSQVTRMMVIEDLQPSSPGASVSFSVADLFQDAAGIQLVVSDFNFSMNRRFRIWFDKSYVFDAFAYKTGVINGFVNRTCYWIDETIDLRGLQTIYGFQPNPAVTVPIHTSPLYLVCLSNTAPPPLGRDAERH